MRNLFFILMILFLAGACAVQDRLAKVAISNGDEAAEDSLQYELIIIDPGFESWFVTNGKPLWYHSQSYLEGWNRQYVMAWNSKAIGDRNSRFFETYIDYQPHIDYGLELNHKLFWYFQYVEQKLKVPILPAGMGPRSVL